MKTKEVTYDENEILSGEGELNIDEVFDLIDEFTWNNHSFISIVLNEINVFQLAYCNDKFMAEITNDSPDMIFHQKYVTEYEVKEMIKYFYEDGEITKDFLSGFYEVPICTKTLDKVIKERNKKNGQQ